MYRSIIRACLLRGLLLGLVTSLGACDDLYREDVVAQANPSNGQIAFDVVKIDDSVLRTVLAEQPPPFQSRFKPYTPPPELKIAVGDTVSVVIWESADNGLFGNSLTELSFSGGAAALAKTGRTSPLGGVPSAPGGLAVSADLMTTLFGDNSANGGTANRFAADSTAGRTLQAEPGGAAATGGTPGAGTAAAARELLANNATSADLLAGNLAGAGGTEAARAREAEKLIDMAEQSGRPGTRIPDQQVGADGSISVPFVGRVAAVDRTPAQVQHAVEHALDGKALDPQVLVAVKKSPANAVSVAGEGVGGARVPLSPGGDRLLQVIAAAGGSKALVHDTYVRLSRNGVTSSVPLATLVADPAQDIYAQPGDVLTLVHRPQTFAVFGATGKNTAITFNSSKLSLAEALGKAGGLLDERADPRAVFLFRYEPVPLVRRLGQPIAADAPAGLSPVVYRLDLMEPKSYVLSQKFPVHDKDVIFVANSHYEKVYQFARGLGQIVGPVETGLLACHYSTNC